MKFFPHLYNINQMEKSFSFLLKANSQLTVYYIFTCLTLIQKEDSGILTTREVLQKESITEYPEFSMELISVTEILTCLPH